MSKHQCPVCKGSGSIAPPKLQQKKSRRVIANAVMAKLLKKEGYSLREISAFLGYRSSRSAQQLIDRKP